MQRQILSDVESENCGGKMRKKNKPLMEKKRRARINKCLSQLKQILIQDEHKNSSSHAKWEKADVLEMTVDYLKHLRKQSKQESIVDIDDETVIHESSPSSSTVTCSPTPSLQSTSLPFPVIMPNVPAIQQFLAYQQLAQISMYSNFQNNLWNPAVFQHLWHQKESTGEDLNDLR